MSVLFLEFFYRLRSHGVPVGTHAWVALLAALRAGVHDNSLEGFYQVARCVLVTSEGHYDAFDQAFAEVFRGVESDRQALIDELERWLADPKQLVYLDPETWERLEALGLDELRRQLLERMKEQKERHDGGSKWIGTGGTSPFGRGGKHPSGVRIGGAGGGRSALAVADARRFRGFRRDLVLDTRQIAAALRRLRRLAREGDEEELDLDETVDETARNCGDLEIVMRPPRRNDVRVLLLLDVGGSMDPHAELVSRLFSAAHRGGGFRELKHYYFHNCVYSRLYEDAQFRGGVELQELLRLRGNGWYLVIVGDAWMHPGELSMNSPAFWSRSLAPSGLSCLARLADRFPHSAWLNPEPPRVWRAPTIQEIERLFPMFHLTLEGIDAMVKQLKRPPSPVRRERIHRLLAS